MPDLVSASAIPSIIEARDALAQLATDNALHHLEAALHSLQGLSASLQSGDRMSPEKQRELERSLLRFRAELRDAGVLAEQGLAFCKEWADLLSPPPAYQSNGAFRSSPLEYHELSLEA
jgi:hypothetical protein